MARVPSLVSPNSRPLPHSFPIGEIRPHMSARTALPTLSFAVLASLALVRPAGAGPWGIGPGEWYAGFEGSTFTANTFHGDGFRADTGLVVEERALRSTFELGAGRRVTLVLGLPVVSITRRDARVQGTASGFQDLLVGARYNLINRSTALALEIDWNAPSGYNRKLDTLGTRLGDGLQELSARLELGTTLGSRGFLQGSVAYGYRYLGVFERDSGPYVAGTPVLAKYQWSDRLHANADVALWMGSSWLVAGRYRGLVTLSHGALVPETNVHLAGPLLLYRVDDRLDVFAGSWSTATGKNTLHYDQVYLGLAFHRTSLSRVQGFLGGTQTP